jgi:large subunit ribosomal protein L24
MPIEASNVMIFNAQTDKGDRVGFRKLETGKKVRYFKSNNEVLDS